MATEKSGLYTDRLATSNRSYFFDVKESARKAPYLIITESRREQNGGYRHERVMVFKEDIEKFQEALVKAAQFVRDQSGG